ncbi:MAG: calcium-binding protein [Burkholderiales bacterium 64-34]|nr:MAG: calcium-binding protein [Burkholderiales bacterium 64-34]
MRIHISLASLVTGWALACGAAWAQAPATTPAKPVRAASAPVERSAAPAQQAALTKGEIKAMREFKMLDFNGDGKLSRTEVKLFPRLAAAFDDADTDKDGYVSYEEVRAFAAKYRAERDQQRAAQAAPASSPQP